MIKTATEPSFQNMGQKMSQFMDQFQKGYYNFYPSETWTPNVNLYETDTCYLLCVDLAGVDKDKIDLEVHEQRLILRGARTVPAHTDDEPEISKRRLRVHLMEIDHGLFSRVVELPRNVEKERIVAHYRNGMLWIEVPKK
jgi:HSP20 family protein